MRKLIQEKQGAFTDVFIFIITAFILVLISALFIYLGATVHDELHASLDSKTRENSSANYSRAIDSVFDDLNVALASLRWISTFLIIGMIIEIFIGSYLVTSRPVFLIPHIFITIIAIIVAVPISNAHEQLLSDSTLGPTLLTFTGTNFLIGHLPTLVAIVGIISGVIMVTKLHYEEESYE